MEHRAYLGDQRLTPHIEYSTSKLCYCIYCGNKADSREHIPSKIFIDKPYPPNLYLVPACKACNNSFSADELYTWFVLKHLEIKFGKPKLSEYEEQRYNKYPSICSEVTNDIHTFSEDETLCYFFRSSRIERILAKLALGHMVYELSEGYHIESEYSWHVERIVYGFRPVLSQEVINDYDCAMDIKELMLPEVGSRVYDHIYPISIPLSQIDNDHMLVLRSLLLDWTDIQDQKYRYIALFDADSAQVNIVIDEFLYTTVFFTRQLSNSKARTLDFLSQNIDVQSMRGVAAAILCKNSQHDKNR